MNDVQSLISRAQRYLATAELLVERQDLESSVSRAYYAMFFCAEALLLTKRLSFSSHRGVISAFGEHFVRTGVLPKELGRALNRAFDKRQLADYEHRFVIGKREPEEILRNGKTFLESVTDVLKRECVLSNE